MLVPGSDDSRWATKGRAAGRRTPSRATVAALGIALALLAGLATTVRGVALFPGSTNGDGAPTDLINNPNDYFSWDDHVITWKMTQEFLNAFPSPIQHEQVRLAFEEWEEASTSFWRRQTTQYTWDRYSGHVDVHDLRTVVLHEIGHTLGSQHPDASWFNEDEANNPFMRNFLPDGMGGWIAGAPPGGELLNEGNTPGFLPGAKPNPPGLRPGEIHRLVSQDELAMLDYVYGRPLVFQEVFGDEDADILLQMHNVGGPPGNNLGAAGPAGVLRDEGDPTQGRRIVWATLSLNANPNTPMGVLTRPTTWKYTNKTGKEVDSLFIRTRGSDNPSPIDHSSTGQHRFTNLAGLDHDDDLAFEDRTWIFRDPAGGPIPDGDDVRAGLELDVWDWTVFSASAKTTDDVFYPACLVTVIEATKTTLPPEPFPDGGSGGDGGPFLDDLILDAPAVLVEDPAAPSGDVTSRGFVICNGDAEVLVTEVVLIPMVGQDAILDNLSDELRDALLRSGRALTVPLPGPIPLFPHDEVEVILSPPPPGTSPDITRRDNVILMHHPELMEDKLIVSVETDCEFGTATTFSLLNTEPVGRPGRPPREEPDRPIIRKRR